MALRECNNHLLFAKNHPTDVCFLMPNAAEPDIDLTAFQRSDLVHRRHLVEAEFDCGVLVAESPDDFGQHFVQGRANETYREAALNVAHAPRHGFEIGRLSQQLEGMSVKELARLR